MILPRQELKKMISGAHPVIISRGDVIDEAQIQPASVDCRFGTKVYRMATAMTPRSGETVRMLIQKYAQEEYELKEGTVLKPGECYLIPLQESLQLPLEFHAVFSPKSSTGRMDVFVRVISDGNPQYDAVPAGYTGELWLEVAPLTFAVGIAPGLSLTQMRIRSVAQPVALSGDSLRLAHTEFGLVYENNGAPIRDADIKNDSLYLHADLSSRARVGFRARKGVTTPVDLFRKQHYDVADFWDPIERPENGEMILAPGEFYLLASKERVSIPPPYAGEVVTYDISSGEFRTHYAGFFDNGFGGTQGTNAVLEVRAHDVPFRLCDGQPICRMVFEETMGVPEKMYGADLGSHYTGAGPLLSKHFKKIDW